MTLWPFISSVGVACAQTPVVFSVADGSMAKEPQVALAADRTVYVAFGSGNEVRVARSTDEGKSFSVALVSAQGKLALGMRRGPRIAMHGRTVTVSAIVGERGGGRDGDLVAWKSVDGGKSWTGPSKINDVPGSAREGLHAMAVAPNGTLACTWLDLRAKGTKLYTAFSKDGGGTWGPNRLAYESPSGTICECCHPSLDFNAEGKLWAMFRNALDGERDMYFTFTSDEGQTFAPAQKLGKGTWKIAVCPMDGGMLSVRHGLQSVWRREDALYFSAVGATEAEIDKGKQPWIAAGADGHHTVWMRGRQIMAKSEGAEPLVLSENGDDPVVSASPDGRTVLAAWTENGIRAAYLRRP